MPIRNSNDAKEPPDYWYGSQQKGEGWKYKPESPAYVLYVRPHKYVSSLEGV